MPVSIAKRPVKSATTRGLVHAVSNTTWKIAAEIPSKRANRSQPKKPSKAIDENPEEHQIKL